MSNPYFKKDMLAAKWAMFLYTSFWAIVHLPTTIKKLVKSFQKDE